MPKHLRREPDLSDIPMWKMNWKKDEDWKKTRGKYPDKWGYEVGGLNVHIFLIILLEKKT